MRKPYPRVKRVLDLVLGLTLAAPALIIVVLCSILIKLETKGPAFFIQDRPGYKGNLFKIYKLRTMVLDTQRDGRLLSDMQRMTNIGKIIRELSLDELPQIINVLRGEMSFIGPRPLLKEYLPLYSKEQIRRHDVRPGISGWAQVNGRNEVSWDQRFEHDLWYVDNLSFKLDMKIFYLTFKNILCHAGINADAGITMSDFSGTEM